MAVTKGMLVSFIALFLVFLASGNEGNKFLSKKKQLAYYL